MRLRAVRLLSNVLHRCRTAWRPVLATLAGVGCLVAATAPALASCAGSVCHVKSEADLVSAINYANANASTTIHVDSHITLTSGNLPPLQASDLKIKGNGHVLNGNGQYRGLFAQSGSARVEDLHIHDAVAQGGDGHEGGGGGAGLGGALFVADGASLTVSGVSAHDSIARGGTGSGGLDALGGGGGGLFGDGGDYGSVGNDGVGGGGGGLLGDGFNGDEGGMGGAGGGGDGGDIESGSDGETFGGGGGAGTGMFTPTANGGNGGFGGGGGGGNLQVDDDDPYGAGGSGGFGGGGGAGNVVSFGGFGGGNGTFLSGGGGGGMGGAIFVMEGGTLGIEGALSVDGNTVEYGEGGGVGGNGSAYGGGMFLQGDGTLTFRPDEGETQTFNDAIADQTGADDNPLYSGSWSLVKDGGGTLNLNADNAFSGGVTVKDGTLVLNANNTFNQSSDVTVEGGTLRLGADTAAGTATINMQGAVLDYADGVSILNFIQLEADGTRLNVDSGTAEQSNTISETGGSWSLEKTGAGRLVLGETNSFSGPLTVSGGTLELRNGHAIWDAAVVTVNTGATLALGDEEVIGSLAGGGDVEIGSGLALTTINNNSTTFSGVISGDAAFTKSGTGTMILSGANTYTGGTTISGGTLQVGAGGSSGSIVGDVSNGATLAFDRAGTYDFGGVISGTGSVIKRGSGTLTLSGDNTFLGGVTLHEGTLRLATDTAAGSGTITTLGSVIDYANGVDVANVITIDSNTTQLRVGSGTAEQSGMISEANGARPLQKTGAGTLVLSATNAFTGLLTISGGTLEVRNGFAIDDETPVFVGAGAALVVTDSELMGALSGAGSVAIGSGQTLTTGGAGSSVLSGVISGDGALTKTGSGTMTVSGRNTYTGGTTISDGTLQIGIGGNTGSIEGDVVNNGTLAFARAGSLEFGGVISGTGGVNKLGTGTLVLSGVNTYTGDTVITSGTLVVDGSLQSANVVVEGGTLDVNGSISSGVTVDGGARFDGTGSVGALTVNSGGVHAPGNSIGTQTVNGNYLLHAGSVLQIEANAAGQSDQVVVNGGTVTLSGARLQVLAAFGDYSLATDYTIIDNDGADPVTGTFGSLSVSSLFLDASVNYAGGDGNDVVLNLVRNELKMLDLAHTRNERAVAWALDQFPTENPVFEQVFAFDGNTARSAYNALTGEVHATLPGVLANQSWFTRETILSRLMQAQHSQGGGETAALGGSGPTTVATLGEAPLMGLGAHVAPVAYEGPMPQPAYGSGLTFWTQGFGAWGDFDGDGNAATADRTLGGFLSGVDAGLGGGWRAGLATGYTQTNVNVAQRASSATVDSYTLAGYAGGASGGLALRGAAAWTWHGIDSTRAVVFPGFFELQTADYDGGTGQVFAEVAAPLALGPLAMEPFVGGAFVHVGTGGFAESGPEVALASSGSSDDIGYSTVGLRMAGRLPVAGAAVSPHLSLAWQHAFGDTTPEVALVFSQYGIGMGISGVPVAADTALIEAGIGVALAPDATLSLSYQGQLAADVQDNGLKGSFDWRF
jgi:autotransporter-associated beta strand protein